MHGHHGWPLRARHWTRIFQWLQAPHLCLRYADEDDVGLDDVLGDDDGVDGDDGDDDGEL